MPIHIEPEKEDYVDATKGLVVIRRVLDDTYPKLVIELSLSDHDMNSLKEICIRIFNGKSIIVLNDDFQRIGMSVASIGDVGVIKP